MLGGMFKLNVMTVIPKMNKDASSSTYMLKSSNLWHGRLGHVNFESLCRLIKLDHIPSFKINPKHKCETCIKAKLTRSSFHLIKRSSKPLDLVHSDVCDLKFIQSCGGNKYFITYVDDCTKY